MGRRVYDSVAWRRVRRLVLVRDGGVCQIRGRPCTLVATEVDHVVSPVDGGDWFDPGNLRAACKPCNAERGGRLGRAKQLSVRVVASRDWW